MLGAEMVGSDGLPIELHERHEEFKEIEFKRRELKHAFVPESGEMTYLVYKTPKEAIEVMAVSAKDALEKCGIKSPVRIMRADMIRKDVLEEGLLKPLEEEKPAGTAAPEAAATAAKPQETVETPTDSAKTAPPEGEPPAERPPEGAA